MKSNKGNVLVSVFCILFLLCFRSSLSMTAEGERQANLTEKNPQERTSNRETCEYHLNATAEMQNITSPGFPKKYPKNLKCQWTIAASEGFQVRLQFISFYTESCCDHLEIFDGEVLRERLRGLNRRVPLIISTNGSLRLNFHTNQFIQYQGFIAIFNETNESIPRSLTDLRPPAPCGFNATANTKIQDLYSPGWPDHYANRLDCVWVIKAREGKQVKFDLNEFITERCCDELRVYDGEKEVAKFKGDDVPSISIVSAYGKLVLRFKSDRSVTKEGFEATFVETDDTPDFSNMGPAPCGFDAIAISKPRYINSPNYPKLYQRNVACTWKIRAKPGKQVAVKFTLFDTEKCCDKLQVYDDDKKMAVVSGIKLQELEYVSTTGILLLTFTSDSSKQSHGFQGTFREFPSEMPSPISPPLIEDSCGFNRKAAHFPQTVTSPNWPQNYPSNHGCIWRLFSPPGEEVVLTIHALDTEECCDTIMIFDRNLLIRTLRGSSIPAQSFKSTSGKLIIRFHSDVEIEATGFQASFMAVRPSFDGTVPLPTTTAITTTTQPTTSTETTTTESGTTEPKATNEATTATNLTITTTTKELAKTTSTEVTVTLTEMPKTYLTATMEAIRTTTKATTAELITTKTPTEPATTTKAITMEPATTTKAIATTTKVITNESTTSTKVTATTELTKTQPTTTTKVITTTAAEVVRIEPTTATKATTEVTTITSTHEPTSTTKATATTKLGITEPIPTEPTSTTKATAKTKIAITEPITTEPTTTTKATTEETTTEPTTTTKTTTTELTTIAWTTPEPTTTTEDTAELTILEPTTIEPTTSTDVTTTTTKATTIKPASTTKATATTEVTTTEPFSTTTTMQATTTHGTTKAKKTITTEPITVAIETTTTDETVTKTATSTEKTTSEVAVTTTEALTAAIRTIVLESTTEVKTKTTGPKIKIEQCGFEAKATDSAQIIVSPNYPQPYPENTTCRWNLHASTEETFILLGIDTFETEECCDTLQIYDNGMLVETLQGSSVPFTMYRSSSNNLEIYFTSLGNSKATGFQLSYSTSYTSGTRWPVGSETCGFASTASDKLQWITSPRWPQSYSSSQHCKWTIQGQNEMRIRFSIDSFDTEECCDYLEFVEDEAIIKQLKGKLNPSTFVSESSNVTVIFQSDGSVERIGFQVTYELESKLDKRKSDNFRCYSGIRAVGSNVDLDEEGESPLCGGGFSCMEVSAIGTTEVTVDGESSSVRISIGQCVPNVLCGGITCTQVQNRISTLIANNLENCHIRCCRTHMCNRPIRGIAMPAHSSITRQLQLNEEPEPCYGEDVPFLSGCTYRELYNHVWLCSSLFFNGYPYLDTIECGKNMLLYRSCFDGVQRKCTNGRKKMFAQPRDGLDENLRIKIIQAFGNLTAVLQPSYDVFCERIESAVEEISGGIFSAIDIIREDNNLFCDAEGLAFTKTDLKNQVRLLITSNSEQFCRLHQHVFHLAVDVVRACPITYIERDSPLDELRRNTNRLLTLLPGLLEEYSLPKCTALQNIESFSETNGIPMINFTNPDSKGCYSYDLDMMILMDGSGSVGREEFPELIKFVKNVTSYFDLNLHHIGVMQYSHYISGRALDRQTYFKTEIHLGEYKRRIEFDLAMDAIRHHGYTTYTAHAIQKAVYVDMGRSHRYMHNCTKKAVVVITDGTAADVNLLRTYSNSARALGVELFAVGVNKYVKTELQIIASGEIGNDERVYTTTSYHHLVSQVSAVLKDDLYDYLKRPAKEELIRPRK